MTKTTRSRGVLVLGVVSALALLQSLRAAPAQFAPPVEVPLPALLEVQSDAWLWTSFDGVEILSLAAEDVTRTMAENVAVQRANLEALVPADHRVTWDRPMMVVFYGTGNPRPMPIQFVVILQKKLTEQERARAVENREGKPLEVFPNPQILPSTWAEEADQLCVFNIVTPTRGRELSPIPASSYVRYLLESRTPPHPQWFIDGFIAFYGRGNVVGREMELAPIVWISGAQTQLMMRDKKIRPELVPLTELFAWTTPGAVTDERMRSLLTSQAELFIRWAFDARGSGGAEALWSFLAGPTTGPGSAGRFEKCFGMTEAAALESIRAYFPTAIRKPTRLNLRRDSRAPEVAIRSATPVEIARIKSEWDRLGGRIVGREHPELQPFYHEQARRTLERVPEALASDPELLASKGLLFVDTGDDASALPLIERACAAERPRPRAAVELARIQVARAREVAVDGRLDAATIEKATAPLRGVLSTKPPMALAYQVLAEAWIGAASAAPAADLDRLLEGARLLPRDVPMLIAIARLMIEQGRIRDAQDVIERGLTYVTDDGGRRRLFAIRSAARAAAPK